MKREIYKVYAEIVDANGSQNPLSGYPKVFDSKNYSNDCEKTRRRAYAEFDETKATMRKRDDRQEQVAFILRLSDAMVLDTMLDGKLAELPDPEPAPEEEGGGDD